MLDATRCLSYWTQSADPFPEEYREALGDRVYGCDICQDVCPWNRGVEKRRAGETAESVEAHVSLADWLQADDGELAARYDRLFVPRNDPRYLRRNALVALGNAGGEPVAGRAVCGGRRPAAARARRVGAGAARGERRAAAVARRRALDRLGPARRRPVRDLPGGARPALPADYELWAWLDDGVFAVGALGLFALSRREWPKQTLQSDRARGAHLRLRDRLGLHADLQLRAGLAHPAGDVPAARRGRAALRDRGRARAHRRERAGDGRPSSGCASDRFAPRTLPRSTTSRSSSGSRCCWA